jgi:hypothetical protein
MASDCTRHEVFAVIDYRPRNAALNLIHGPTDNEGTFRPGLGDVSYLSGIAIGELLESGCDGPTELL